MLKPLLAPNKDPLSYPTYFQELRYPLLCSPKYDGIRCLIKNGVAYSRSGKPLRSVQVQDEFTEYNHFDGELIEGLPTDEGVYNRTQSYVMSFDKPGNLHYYVFDYTAPDMLNEPYIKRLEELASLKIKQPAHSNFTIVNQRWVVNEFDLLQFEKQCIEKGFEGIMMRSADAPYKQGRGTFKEGIIYKLKRFEDAEGVILDFKERMINENEQERSELGYAKRSSAKEGMVPGNTLGVFVVDFLGEPINVSPGSFNHDDLKLIWENKEDFRGKYLKFRFFNYGIKDAPRVARAIGFRDLGDM